MVNNNFDYLEEKMIKKGKEEKIKKKSKMKVSGKSIFKIAEIIKGKKKAN